MERIKRDQTAYHGRLPASAPLANPYVPFQTENPPKYDMRKGMVRGTLFPGLDLPFMGMLNKNPKRITPMTELQALAFTIQELALYLDTHRDDCEAMELYRSYQKNYSACMDEYQKKHGPLNHRTPYHGPTYAWLDDPWPWEYCKNREG